MDVASPPYSGGGPSLLERRAFLTREADTPYSRGGYSSYSAWRYRASGLCLLDGTNGLVELGFASTGLLWAWGAALYRFFGKKSSHSCPSSAACSSGGMSASE